MTRRRPLNPALLEVEVITPDGTDDELDDVQGLLMEMAQNICMPSVCRRLTVGIATAREIEILKELVIRLEKASGL